ncbi:hypothetical protein PHYSODRAFT_257835 [Phytophthora sojae]|uniref:MULE transposase domain-containing protein n=1 Tax=Phytophthora sojae (strain P6497) TaxID=1094619 RepID=G4YWC3_PHYSP|nr:hypothetical protein PHYSODRAFT_257835 [Phytophthora sojae]EGZ25570.1 hypothetical protein PHYSODRAFT_257835 [Phytophthora sojae]|eukprot:XP_009520858.1 hypothetical protein PHYSODRAFT_257835 [Phytophthora sojae]
MPTSHDWQPLCSELSERDDDMLLLGMKAFKASRSQLMPCTACASATVHLMRYKILLCACKQCKAVAPFAKCPWRAKVLICQESKTVTMSERGKHFSAANPRRKPTITRAQRAFIHDMTRENLTPLRILHAMSRKFGLRLEDLPEIRKVQNCVSHYLRAKLGGNDRVSDVATHVAAYSFTGSEAEHDAFTFTRDTNARGKCITGDGSDKHPFVVGVTTKVLLRSAKCDPASVILHVDATFQLDRLSYPVIVVGLSDGSRAFHLLALFVTSQLEERHFTDAFAALRTVYAQVVGEAMRVRYVMADADAAQFNAVQSVFGIDCTYTYLMCFYHVIAKVRVAVKERMSGVHGDVVAEVYRDIYDLHFSLTEAENLTRNEKVLFEWNKRPELDAFRKYMKKQLMKGKFSSWQCYLTPTGFATTNNPCETFNRAFKRDYTQKRKLKLVLLLQQMRDCCSHRSMAALPILQRRKSDKLLQARATSLRTGGYLREHVHERSSIGFLIDDTNDDIVRVLAAQPPRFYVPSRGRTEKAADVAARFSVNYAMMEVEAQPSTGWPVDITAGHCPCDTTQR